MTLRSLFAPPTVSESNKTFKDPFILTVSQDEMGSNLKDFCYSKSASTSVAWNPLTAQKAHHFWQLAAQPPINAGLCLALEQKFKHRYCKPASNPSS
jgi:hypothetical protein